MNKKIKFCKYCGGRKSEIPKMRDYFDENTGKKEGYIILGCTKFGCEGRCEWEGHKFGHYFWDDCKCKRCGYVIPSY